MIFSINHVWNNNNQKKWENNKFLLLTSYAHLIRQLNISIYMAYRYRYTWHMVTDYLHLYIYIYMAVQDRKKATD